METKITKRWIQKNKKMLKQIGEVDLDEELKCALRKIKKTRKHNKKKEQLQKCEVEDHDLKDKMSQSLEEIETIIKSLKDQLEEEIMIK